MKCRVDPMSFPLQEGESWWVVHPNLSNCEFKVPNGAITVCTSDFLCFSANTAYTILGNDSNNGWITLQGTNSVWEMPYYLFARHFDAEAFVRGVIDPSELEGAKPFDYRPTLPKKPESQLELFQDRKDD